MTNPDVFSSLGDVDEMLRPAEASSTEETNNSTEMSEDATGSNNPVASGNELQVDDLVGDIDAGGITGAANSGDVNAGTVAGNGVTDVVGDVQDTVGGVGDIAGAGDITGGMQDFGGVTPETGDVTNAQPLENTSDLGGAGDLSAPVTGSENPTGAVGDVASDLTGGLGL